MTTNAHPSTSLKQAVDQTRCQHVAAVNAGDAGAATSLFAPTAVFLPPGQPALQGSAEIQAWFSYVFANFQVDGFALEPGTARSTATSPSSTAGGKPALYRETALQRCPPEALISRCTRDSPTARSG